jgi:crotonobetainyl-CoA:carnitine CoA-transferase CaiB-like acyl-CoA transferase
MAGPLQGIKVLDFTLYVNGPSATMKLADAGAEVLKVEPLEGSGERLQAGTILEDGFNFQHMHNNRGKKSIAIDLKHPSAMSILEKFVRWADVLANNFRPGVLDRLGLSYEQCSAWNPQLIYTSNSGWGPVGEHAERPSFDGIAQAYAGCAVEQGGGPTNGTPQLVGWAFTDEIGALNYSQSILQALVARARTGAAKLKRSSTSQIVPRRGRGVEGGRTQGSASLWHRRTPVREGWVLSLGSRSWTSPSS